MRLPSLTVIIASTLVSACHIGGTAAEYIPARVPEGAPMVVFTDKERLAGELVEVRENGVVLALSDGRIVLVPWSITASGSAEGVPGTRTIYGQKVQPGAEVRGNLAKISHFPQGMTPDIQSRFLAAHKQSEVVVVK